MFQKKIDETFQQCLATKQFCARCFVHQSQTLLVTDLIRASCVGRDVRLASSATAADMRAQLRSIDQVDGVRVVVLFTSAEETGRILEVLHCGTSHCWTQIVVFAAKVAD